MRQLALAVPAARHALPGNPLRAVRVHRRLRVASLPEFRPRVLAHQRAPRVRQVRLPPGVRLLARRPRRPPGPVARLARLRLALAPGPPGLRPLPRLALQALARLFQLALEVLPPRDLPRQPPGVFRRQRVGVLRPGRQLPDPALQSLDQLAAAGASCRAALAGRPVHPGAVDADGADLEHVRFARRQQRLQEALGHGVEGLAPEPGDGVAFGVQAGGREAQADVAAGGAIDAARGEDAAGVAVDRQGERHARLALRRAGAALVDAEALEVDMVDGLDDETGEVVGGDPVAPVDGQKEGLLAVARHELRYGSILQLSENREVGARASRQFHGLLDYWEDTQGGFKTSRGPKSDRLLASATPAFRDLAVHCEHLRARSEPLLAAVGLALAARRERR